jgi:hypothetical protein
MSNSRTSLLALAISIGVLAATDARAAFGLPGGFAGGSALGGSPPRSNNQGPAGSIGGSQKRGSQGPYREGRVIIRHIPPLCGVWPVHCHH